MTQNLLLLSDCYLNLCSFIKYKDYKKMYKDLTIHYVFLTEKINKNYLISWSTKKMKISNKQSRFLSLKKV